MRKTFLTICAAAFVLLAVSSCGKLEDGLNSLKGEVADLKERVDQLEQKLNSEVKAINDVVATLATKQELTTGLNNLKTQLDAKDAELASAIQAVNSTLNGLDAKYAGKADFNTLVTELQGTESELRTQLQNLLTALGTTQAEVAAMEAELLAKVAEEIQKVAVQNVKDNGDGTYTLTLASGKKFTVAEPDPNANNAGLVTVKNGEWVVMNADGTYDSIDVPVGVEELEFSVDYETKELMYSVNGGELVPTGAYVTDWDGCLVTDFYEDESFVYFTIGGEEYTLVKASTASSNLLAGKTYFTAGQTKTIKFDVKGVKSGFVAGTPKGWDVELNFAEKTLTVTAPAEGVGAESGIVEVWFLSNDGVVVNSALQVVVGPEVIEVTVDPKTNAVTMKFNQVDGETPEVIYGATLASEFNDEYVEYLLSNLNYLSQMGFRSNLNEMNPDNVALREKGFNGTMADLVEGVSYTSEYVVWAIEPVWSKGSDYGYQSLNTSADFVRVYHQMNAMDFSVESSLADAEISIELFDNEGTVGFYGFYVSQWNEFFLEGLQDGMYKITDLVGGMFGNEIPCRYYDQNSVTIKLSEFGVSDEMMQYDMYNTITPLTKAKVGIIPYNKYPNEMTFGDIIIKEVSTSPVTIGSEIEYTLLDESKDYTSVSMTLSAPDAAYVMYYVYGPDDVYFGIPETDEEVLEALPEYYVPDEFMYGEFEVPGQFTLVKQAGWGETPGTEYNFVVVFIGEEGKAKIFRKTMASESLPVNEELSLGIIAAMDELTGKPYATFTITGEAAKLYYTCNTGYSTSVDNQIAIIEGNSNGWTEVDLTSVDGEYTVDNLKVVANNYTDSNNYVHAFLVDSEGNVSEEFLSAKFVVPKGYVNE